MQSKNAKSKTQGRKTRNNIIRVFGWLFFFALALCFCFVKIKMRKREITAPCFHTFQRHRGKLVSFVVRNRFLNYSIVIFIRLILSSYFLILYLKSYISIDLHIWKILKNKFYGSLMNQQILCRYKRPFTVYIKYKKFLVSSNTRDINL